MKDAVKDTTKKVEAAAKKSADDSKVESIEKAVTKSV